MTVTCDSDSYYCTCLGHIGWQNAKDAISVALLKVIVEVAKARQSRVAVDDGFAL